jgi:HEAT repeat protein
MIQTNDRSGASVPTKARKSTEGISMKIARLAWLVVFCHGLIANIAVANDATLEGEFTVGALLRREVSVAYRGASLIDVLSDLEARYGLKSAFSSNIETSAELDLVSPRISINEILSRLKVAGGIELKIQSNEVVFWQDADDATIRDLDRRVRDLGNPARCQALMDLAQLSDLRIYPILFWAMSEGSEAMALCSAEQLYAKHLPTLCYGSDFELLAKGLTRLLETRPADRRWLIELAGYSRQSICGETLLPIPLDAQFKSQTIHILGRTRTKAAVAPLIELFKTAKPPDPNQDTGYVEVSDMAIAHVLTTIGGESAMQAVRKRMEQESGRRRKAEFASVLHAAGDDEGLNTLLYLLNEKKEDGGANIKSESGGGQPAPPRPIRVVVTSMLGGRGSPRAIEALIGLLRDPEIEVAREAARQLGALSCKKAVPQILELLKTDPLPFVEINALAKIGDRDSIDSVVGLLDHADPMVKLTAAELLLDFGDPRGIDAMDDAYPQLDSRYHFHAMRRLARLHHSKTMDKLISQLNPMNTTRTPRDAADILAPCRYAPAIPALVRALENSDVNSSFAAAAALAQLPPSSAIEQAVALLESEDVSQREWGAKILSWIKSPDLAIALEKILDDSSKTIRSIALRELIQHGGERGIELALERAEKNAESRQICASALAGTRNPKEIKVLFGYLAEGELIADTAAESLILSLDPAVIQRLLILAKGTSDDPAGYAAGRAFERLGKENGAKVRSDYTPILDILLMLANQRFPVRVETRCFGVV